MAFPLPTVTDPEVQAALDRVALELRRLSQHEFSGTGSPEGVVTAPVGSRYRRKDGGAGTSFYIKESGTAANGWVAK